MCIHLHRELEEIYLFHLKTQFVPSSKNAPSRLCTALFNYINHNIDIVLYLREKNYTVFDYKLSPFCECCIFFGDSPATEFSVPKFRNTVCSIFIGCLNKKNNWDDIARVFIQVKFGSTKSKLRHRKFRRRGVTQKKEYNYTVTHRISC